MNIIIIGGGTPGKLGNRIALRAQTQGHQVVSLSHTEHKDNGVSTVVCNFNNYLDVVDKFRTVVGQLGDVDLLLYCSRNYNKVDVTTEAFDNNMFSLDDYNTTLNIDVIIPHMIAMTAHQLKLSMHMIFFTTFILLNLAEKDPYRKYVTYTGGKAWQLQLMRGISTLESTVKASSLSVHFDWEASQFDNNQFDIVYKEAIKYSALRI